MSYSLVNYLSKFPYTREEITAIIESTKTADFKKGHTLVHEGDVSFHCYFIITGCVRQYQLINGEERTIAFFTEEQMVINYESYLTQKPSRYTIVCSEDCTLMYGTAQMEARLHRDYPRLEFLTSTLMQEDFKKTNDHLTNLISLSPEERYHHLLDTRPGLLDRFPHYQIASYLGITPESLSRIRKRILDNTKSL